MRMQLLMGAAIAAISSAPALAQSVVNTVNSATRSVASTVSGPAGSGAGGAQNPYAALNDTSSPSGVLPGGMKLKYGGKEIQLRGAVGIGDGQNGARAGASIPF